MISALSASAGQPQWQTPLKGRPQTAQMIFQARPASTSTFGPVFNALSVINGVVIVSYISTTPTTKPVIAALNAGTGQQDWSAEGVLLAVG